MSLSLYPVDELGLLWIQATVITSLVWLIFRTELIPFVVATTSVYVFSIMVWMSLVYFDVPTIWSVPIEGREYPLVTMVGVSLLLAVGMLKVMHGRSKRRAERRRESREDHEGSGESPEPAE